jgi:hypothetical protein
MSVWVYTAYFAQQWKRISSLPHNRNQPIAYHLTYFASLWHDAYAFPYTHTGRNANANDGWIYLGTTTLIVINIFLGRHYTTKFETASTT